MKKKINKKIAGAIGAIAVIAIVGTTAIVPNVKFNKAISMLEVAEESSDYEDAMEILSSIKDKKYDAIFESCKKQIAAMCEKGNSKDADYFAMQLAVYKVLSETDLEYLDDYTSYCTAEKYVSDGQYLDAYYEYPILRDFEDSAAKREELLENHKDAFYDYAIEKYESGTSDSLLDAQAWFEKLADYESSKEYLDNIEFIREMGGVYAGLGYKQGDSYYSVSGLEALFHKTDEDIIRTKLMLSSYNDKPCLVEISTEATSPNGAYAFMYNEKGTMQMYYVAVDSNNEIVRIVEEGLQKTDRDYFDEELTRTPPQIGMTAEQVEKSTWGKPSDINRSTFEWGTTEQWCYSGFRYVYFENGVVTAIQE